MTQAKVIDADGLTYVCYVFLSGQKGAVVDYVRGHCRLLGDA
jgi:hypothetical protein